MFFTLSLADKAKFDALLSSFDKNVAKSRWLNERMAHHDRSLLKEATCLQGGDYAKDSYSLAVKPRGKKIGNWTLGYERYEPKEVFLSGGIESLGKPYFMEKNPLGYFLEPFSYLSVKEDETTWMSVIPHEINTMKEPLSHMKGRVVVMGLGLGYFAFHCLEKKEVTSLVVVEKDSRLISLFNEELKPFFPNASKLTILAGDAYDEKIVGAALRSADTVFYDLWHNEEDGLPLLRKAYQEAKKYPNADFSFWMEPSLLAYYRRVVIILLDAALNYPSEKEDDDEIMSQTKKALADQRFTSYEDIENLLSNEGLKDLLCRLG